MMQPTADSPEGAPDPYGFNDKLEAIMDELLALLGEIGFDEAIEIPIDGDSES